MKPVVRFVSYCTSLGSVLWLVALVCDRLYVLHLTYSQQCAQFRKDQWVVAQCQKPEFFEALPGSCREAEQSVMRNLVLYSLKHVLETTYVCGKQSCSEMTAEAVAWFIQLSTPVMILLSAMAVVCPVVLVQLLRAVAEAFRPHRRLPEAFYSLPEEPAAQPLFKPTYQRLPCYELKCD